ncbi:MAG TPA: Nif3-like dinuclear metal center hexameric protein [Candidatus Kapabacteria bacterium]
MKLSNLVTALGKILPLRSAGYEKDAVGLQVGFAKEAELTKALVAYEVTDDVVAEAMEVGANIIISYHPLIFPNVSSITDATRTGALLTKLIKSDIALYVVHTAFDANPEFGTSRSMADALGLANIKPLAPLPNLLEKIVVFAPEAQASAVQQAMWQAGAGHISNYDECSFTVEGEGTFRGNASSNPTIGTPLVRESLREVRIEMIAEKWKTPRVISAMKEAHTYDEVAYDVYPLTNGHPHFGMGSVGELSVPMTTDGFLKDVKRIFGTPTLRHNGIQKSISKVAMLGGSGMEYYSSARAVGADCFITGDIRYHDFFRAAHDGILLIDAGHAETERFVSEGLMRVVLKSVHGGESGDETSGNFVINSRRKSNIVHYY